MTGLKRLFYTIWFAVLLAPSSVAVAVVQDNFDRLEKAANLIRQGQLASAASELELVLRKSPLDANALNLLGVVRAQQHRLVEAEKLFLSALRQSPKLAGAYINLGRLYLDQKQVDRAVWAYSEAEKLAPENAEIQYQLASLYDERRDCARALSHLKRIPQPVWRTEELYIATKCYLDLGQKSDALAIITSLNNAGRLTGEEAAGFASALLKKDLSDDAISILESTLRKYPTSFALLYQLGASYAAKKQWLKAEQFYAAALEVNGQSVPTLRELARVARALGELEKALSYLVRARKLSPDDRNVLYDFAVAAFSMNLIVDALPVAEKLYKEKPDNPPYVHLLAVCRFRHDEKGTAEKLLRQYIELRPRDTLGYYLLGVTLYTVKRYAEAREALQKSLTFGNNSDSEYMLGLIAENEGDNASALRWLQRVTESSTSYAAAQTLLGIVYAEQNNVSAARTTLEHAVQLNAKDLRAHYQLGLVYAKLGLKNQAQQMFAIADRLREEQRNEEVISFKLIDPPQ